MTHKLLLRKGPFLVQKVYEGAFLTWSLAAYDMTHIIYHMSHIKKKIAIDLIFRAIPTRKIWGKWLTKGETFIWDI